MTWVTWRVYFKCFSRLYVVNFCTDYLEFLVIMVPLYQGHWLSTRLRYEAANAVYFLVPPKVFTVYCVWIPQVLLGLFKLRGECLNYFSPKFLSTNSHPFRSSINFTFSCFQGHQRPFRLIGGFRFRWPLKGKAGTLGVDTWDRVKS